jgi:hypothetical protein
MVASPESYLWSSYKERKGLEVGTMLDVDVCYQALGMINGVRVFDLNI